MFDRRTQGRGLSHSRRPHGTPCIRSDGSLEIVFGPKSIDPVEMEPVGHPNDTVPHTMSSSCEATRCNRSAGVTSKSSNRTGRPAVFSAAARNSLRRSTEKPSNVPAAVFQAKGAALALVPARITPSSAIRSRTPAPTGCSVQERNNISMVGAAMRMDIGCMILFPHPVISMNLSDTGRPAPRCPKTRGPVIACPLGNYLSS